MEPAEKTPKKRQNRANLLIMVSSRSNARFRWNGLQKHRKPTLVQFGPEVSAGQRRLGVGRKHAKSCSREQNWGNLVILVCFRFQHPIPVKWPAKAQETEFGAIRSRGKRRAAEKTPKKRQNRANLLIMVSSRFQRPIQVEWPAKTQVTEFGVIRSRGKRRTASSWSRPKKRKSCSREQNWGNLVILVCFRFQHPIPVKWPAKAQETEFGAIRSRGKRKAASSWSQLKKRQKNAKTVPIC